MSHTVRLNSDRARETARQLVTKAPDGFIMTIAAPKRTNDQNALMWALLSEVSRAKPEGRSHTPEVWKCLFMASAGHQARFEMGLDNRPFPVGFSTSGLNKQQMSDLLETIYEYCARHGVVLSEAA